MGTKMKDEVLLEIQEFCKKNNCPAIIQYDGKFFTNGSADFLKEKSF